MLLLQEKPMDDERLIEAHQLHQQGMLEEALTCYENILKDNPDEADLHHISAILRAELNQTKKALTSINQAISLCKDDPRYYNSKANILLRAHQIDQAIQSLEQGLTIDPNYAIGHNTIGLCYYKNNQLKQAKSHYEQAIQLNPTFTDAYYNLALSQVCLNQTRHALSTLEQLLKLAPNHVKGYGLQAEIHLNESNATDASKAYLKRIDLQPHHSDSYYGLGVAYLQLSKYKDACLALEQALALECTQPDVNHILANGYLQQSDHAKALSYYMRQLEISPLFETYYNIGIILMYQERNKDALDYLHQAEKLSPDDLPCQINLGALNLKIKKYPQAITHYQKALNLSPDNKEIQHILAAISNQEANNTPSRAPNDYIENLFNQYALYYDKHLTEALKYNVPTLIKQRIIDDMDYHLTPPSQWKIVDLGCGTGLSGLPFKAWSSQLTGIDLAHDMIHVAKHKSIYDDLIVNDIDTALDSCKDFDLILACDVFSYFGDLTPLFEKCHSALNSDGILAFSVEKTSLPNYILQKNIRYAHNKDYIMDCLKNASFNILSITPATLRTQQKQPVTGYIVISSAKK